MKDDQLLTLRDVAQQTNTPLGTVRRWVYEKRLPVERVGDLYTLKRVRVRRSVLVALFPHVFHVEECDGV